MYFKFFLVRNQGKVDPNHLASERNDPWIQLFYGLLTNIIITLVQLWLLLHFRWWLHSGPGSRPRSPDSGIPESGRWGNPNFRAVRKERKNLQQMVEKHNSSKVHCLRNSEWVDVWSRDLVPGDVIHVPPGGCTLPADCCLLTGECIVDEGMLTGESIPVIKSPLKLGFSRLQTVYSL